MGKVVTQEEIKRGKRIYPYSERKTLKVGPLPNEAIDPLLATAKIIQANDMQAKRDSGREAHVEIIDNEAINVRPLTLKHEMFLRLYFQGGNHGDAAEGAGFPRSSGIHLMRNPLIRARIAHALGESWVSAEAIVSTLAQIAFNDMEDGHNRVKSLEILSKIKGLFAEPIKIGAMPKDMDALNALLVSEFRRVRGEDPNRPQLLGAGSVTSTPGDPGYDPTDTPALQVIEYLDRCTPASHLEIRIASDGWLCMRCGHSGKCSRQVLEQQLGIRQYVYQDGIWYHPRAQRDSTVR